MKKLISMVIISCFISCCLIGCHGTSFSFKEPISDIEMVEIVTAESSLEYTVLKTLSEEETNEFAEMFADLQFYKDFGDPPGLYGDAIKITYRSGIYVMLNTVTTEYVENGVRQYLFKHCKEDDFNMLMELFLT